MYFLIFQCTGNLFQTIFRFFQWLRDHKFKIHPLATFAPGVILRHCVRLSSRKTLRVVCYFCVGGAFIYTNSIATARKCYFLFRPRGASPYIVVYLTMLIIHEAWWCLLWCNWCLPGLCDAAAASSPIHIPYVCVCFQQQRNSLRARHQLTSAVHTHTHTLARIYTSCERRDSRGECVYPPLWGANLQLFPPCERTHCDKLRDILVLNQKPHTWHEIYATCQSFPLLQTIYLHQ